MNILLLTSSCISPFNLFKLWLIEYSQYVLFFANIFLFSIKGICYSILMQFTIHSHPKLMARTQYVLRKVAQHGWPPLWLVWIRRNKYLDMLLIRHEQSNKSCWNLICSTYWGTTVLVPWHKTCTCVSILNPPPLNSQTQCFIANLLWICDLHSLCLSFFSSRKVIPFLSLIIILWSSMICWSNLSLW